MVNNKYLRFSNYMNYMPFLKYAKTPYHKPGYGATIDHMKTLLEYYNDQEKLDAYNIDDFDIRPVEIYNIKNNLEASTIINNLTTLQYYQKVWMVFEKNGDCPLYIGGFGFIKDDFINQLSIFYPKSWYLDILKIKPVIIVSM